MSVGEREHLTSEIAMLEGLLEEISNERVIERKGFESRLRTAQELLEKLPPETRAHRAKLTFRGVPVVESKGIFASFAGKASHAFSEAVAAAIEGLAGRLGAAGPIAGGDRSRLLIVGTATGSFGFEFEVPAEEQLPECESGESTEMAITKIQELFEEASHGEGEKLADLVAEIHPRAVQKAREFLAILRDNSALCALEYQERSFRFGSSRDVLRSIEQLAEDNIKEDEQELTGVLQGILPDARQIELRLPDEDNMVLRIRIGRELGNIESFKHFFDKRVRLKLRVTEVGTRKPRYELISAPESAE